MKIKVCGMREADNIRQVEALGVDMMGFICWQPSKRSVKEVPAYLPDCERVGVFVDPTLDEVLSWTEKLQLNRIQLHGHETQAFCHAVGEATGLPITKAISINEAWELEQYHEYAHEPSVDLFLFDTKCDCVGGSGVQFAWEILNYYAGSKPFLLAGGIGAGDEQKVLNFHHPKCIGIDLNSRFELSPGLKDAEALKTFISNIR